ncbi:hypothetical protein [Pantoea ananatis]|nr:hypothetical protein [Pantoea ananatis]
MLIELINTEELDLNDIKLHPSLINLLSSYREGKHLLLSNVKFLNRVAEFSALGNITCNTAKNLASRTIEYNQLKDRLSYYCKVDFTKDNFQVVQDAEDENFFVVGFKYFNDTAQIQITKLLCEDINDSKLYSLISNHYKMSNGFRGIDVKFEVCNGGGANTKYNFDMIKNSNNLCLCILDSDKKHPSSGLGSTAAKFNSSSDTAICKHYIMEPHEIESLIPLGVIEHGLTEKRIDNSYIHAFEQASAAINYKPLAKLYLDHKEGLTISGANKIDEKYKDKFWIDVLKNAKNLKKKGCLEKLNCDCSPPCIAIPGFGAGLLDVGTSIIEKMSHVKLKEILPPELSAEWEVIGLKLMSWGCSSSNKIRTS